MDRKYVRDIILLVLGITGIAWFFYDYPSHHPASSVDLRYSRDQIQVKADSVLGSWQYHALDLAGSAHFNSHGGLIDTLQKKYGYPEYRKKMDSSSLNSLPVYYWELEQSAGERLTATDPDVKLSMNTGGKVVGFTAANSFIKEQKPFNRNAVRSFFADKLENYSRTLEDSLISLLVDYQQLDTETEGISRSLQIIDQLGSFNPGRNRDYQSFTEEYIWTLGDYYLQKTMWKNFNLRKDSVALIDDGGLRFARAMLTYNDTTGVKTSLTMDLLPAGSIKALTVNMEPESITRESWNKGAGTILLFMILSFGIWLIVVFYLRIKARAIDTKPALIMAVMGGFLAPGFLVLNFIKRLGLFNVSDIEFLQVADQLLVLALAGAVSAIFFFVLTAVSDSITRQYWPEKLNTWDLVRRGIFKNKPVGRSILSALSVGAVLTGLWSALIHFVPGVYFSGDIGLLTDSYYFASIANILITTFVSLLIVVTIYLIISNQLVGITGRKWFIPVISGLLFAVLDSFIFNVNPLFLEGVINFVIGFTLGYFYLQFDFLTIAIGLFVFTNFVSTAESWLISGSPDINIFYLFVIFLIFSASVSVYFIFSGSEKDDLPEYVPGYIEDQAKEQRLKQELSIARVVQKTFLPSKIQRMPGIDIAGICEPAQETGGDYYDMISLGESRTAIAIGDVSGKGIRAAFYMTFVKGVLHSLSPIILSPLELLNQLNRLFNENATRGTFISMIYGILDAGKKEFTFARAGHNPILVVRKNGDAEWLKPKGLGIGVTKRDSFLKCTEEALLKINEGDVVVLYTDGITEMLNGNDKFYGEEKLEKLVRGVRSGSSNKILEIIIDDVNAFKGMARQHDDMTVVVIKVDASVNQ